MIVPEAAPSRRTTGCRGDNRRASHARRRSRVCCAAIGTVWTIRSADDSASHRGAGQDAATRAPACAGKTSTGDAAAHRATAGASRGRSANPQRQQRDALRRRLDPAVPGKRLGRRTHRRVRRLRACSGGRVRCRRSRCAHNNQRLRAREGRRPPRDNSLDRHLDSGRPADGIVRPFAPPGLGANGRRRRRCPRHLLPRRRSRESSRSLRA